MNWWAWLLLGAAIWALLLAAVLRINHLFWNMQRYGGDA